MDSYDAEQAAELKRKRTFRKFSYRGYELDSLLDMSTEDFMKIVHARARRRFSRGLKRKPMGLIKKLRKAKKEAPANEKPAVVKTHLRDMLVVPEMCGSQIGIYSGRVFNTVEIRPEMIGHYLGEYRRCFLVIASFADMYFEFFPPFLGEFSMSYRPTSHGRSGTGKGFMPLK